MDGVLGSNCDGGFIMKKTFYPPEIEIQTISIEDIITESGKISFDGWGPWE